jgi:hypothetical protein
MTFINGGFPPLIYCVEKNENENENENENSKKTKSREFSTKIKSNINILELLSTTTKKPLINLSNEHNIEDINDI